VFGTAEPAPGGQGDRPLDVVASLAPGGVDADAAADDGAEVKGHRAGVERHDDDLARALGDIGALLRRLQGAGALDGHVGARAAGEAEDRGHRIGLARVDHVVGPQTAAELQPGGPSADQDDLPGPERLARLHGHEPDRPGPEDRDVQPRDVAAGHVEPVQAGAGGGDEHAVLEGQ